MSFNFYTCTKISQVTEPCLEKQYNNAQNQMALPQKWENIRLVPE